MSKFLTVTETSRILGVSQETVRRGIIQGKLPGVAIANDGRQNFLIPRKSVELFLSTSITPMMLAQSVMQAETAEQGIAYLRAALVGDPE